MALAVEAAMTPEQRAAFLDTFTSCANRHWQGAHVADALAVLHSSDSHLPALEDDRYAPLYLAAREGHERPALIGGDGTWSEGTRARVDAVSYAVLALLYVGGDSDELPDPADVAALAAKAVAGGDRS